MDINDNQQYVTIYNDEVMRNAKQKRKEIAA